MWDKNLVLGAFLFRFAVRVVLPIMFEYPLVACWQTVCVDSRNGITLRKSWSRYPLSTYPLATLEALKHWPSGINLLICLITVLT